MRRISIKKNLGRVKKKGIIRAEADIISQSKRWEATSSCKTKRPKKSCCIALIKKKSNFGVNWYQKNIINKNIDRFGLVSI